MNLYDLVNKAPQSIKEAFIYQKYNKGNPVIFPDEDNRYLYILTAGCAEVYKQSIAGAMISLYLYHPYSCFGEAEIFNKEIKTLGIIAKTKCETIILEQSKVLEWMRIDFDFTLYIAEQLAAKLISSTETISKLALLTVKDRVLYTLYTHHKIGDLGTLSKQAMCSEAGVPIRSLNRAISQCINEKFIDIRDKKISVCSSEMLGKYLENKCW